MDACRGAEAAGDGDFLDTRGAVVGVVVEESAAVYVEGGHVGVGLREQVGDCEAWWGSVS